MAREMIIGALKDGNETLEDLYTQAIGVFATEMLERWKYNVPSPGEDAHMEVVHLYDGEDMVGFQLYLVAGEPRRLGPKPRRVQVSMSE